MSARYQKERLQNAAITASGNTVSTTITAAYDHATVYVNVSAATGTTPSLTPTVQASIDGGTTWTDWQAGTAMTAAGSQAIKLTNFTPALMRVAYAVSGTTPSFTTEIWVECMGIN